jgi:uncharacterized protein YegJ (DUF2314 family)
MRFTAETGNFDEEPHDTPPEYLPLRAEMTLTLANVRRAYENEGDEEQGSDSDGVENAEENTNESGPYSLPQTRFRLEPHATQRGQPILLRILPPSDFRGGVAIWLNELLTDLFGSNPQLAMMQSDDRAMEEAHLRAVEELPQVRSRFLSGFRSGEVLHIKHGFPTDDGHEYMWIAVTTWSGERIRGNLANDPQYRNDLRAGQSVEIPESDVFDWLIVHADGRMEGAYTNRVIEEQSEE